MGARQTTPCIEHKNQPNERNDWCFYEAIDTQTITIQIVFVSAMILLLVATSVNFKKLLLYRKQKKYRELFVDAYMDIYFLIYACIVSEIVKGTINIFVFFSFMRSSSHTNTETLTTDPIFILSGIFFFFDYSSTFFLLLMMLFIPYQWSRELLLNTRQNQLIPHKIRLRINKFFNFLNCLKIYYKWIRIWFIPFLVVQVTLLFVSDSSFSCHGPRINSFVIYFESIFIFIVYLFAYYVGRFMQKNNLIKVKREDERRIQFQFTLLVSILIVRCIINFIFKLFQYIQPELDSSCTDDLSQRDKFAEILFLSVGLFVMHFFPLCIILYIYKPSVENRKRDQKILNGNWTEKYQNEQDQKNNENFNSLFTSLNRKQSQNALHYAFD